MELILIIILLIILLVGDSDIIAAAITLAVALTGSGGYSELFLSLS
jgi:hypothetical protein